VLSPPLDHDVRHRLTSLFHTLRAQGFWRLADWSPPWLELGFPPSASQPTLEHVAGQKRRCRRSMMRSSQQLRLYCGVAAVEEADIDYEAASYDVSKDQPVGDFTLQFLGGASQQSPLPTLRLRILSHNVRGLVKRVDGIALVRAWWDMVAHIVCFQEIWADCRGGLSSGALTLVLDKARRWGCEVCLTFCSNQTPLGLDNE
jgi:hypothetical protein